MRLGLVGFRRGHEAYEHIVPAENEGSKEPAGHAVCFMALPELRDGGAEGLADVAKCGVDSARHAAHAGSRTERDQSDDQSIFNKVLTFFTVLEILEIDKEIAKQLTHF